MSYGIWSTHACRFMFGIIEKTKKDAEDRLHARIGASADHPRFVAKQIPGDVLFRMMDQKGSHRTGSPHGQGVKLCEASGCHPVYGDPLEYEAKEGRVCFGYYSKLHNIPKHKQQRAVENAKAKLLRHAEYTLKMHRFTPSMWLPDLIWVVHYEVGGKNIITVGYKVYVNLYDSKEPEPENAGENHP